MDSGMHHPRRAARRLRARIAALLFALPLLLLLLLPPHASAASPVGASPPLRVTLDDNYPPYIFRDADGALQGILVDRWRAWEAATGRAVELHAMDWGVAIARMKAGDYDLIDTIFRTPDREPHFEFSAPYERLEVPIFHRAEITGITDLPSLRGFPVAVKEGDAAVELLERAGVRDLILHRSYEAIVEAARRHQVNVFVIDAPPAHHLLHKANIHRDFRMSEPVSAGHFHRAVRRGDGALLSAVEAGFATIAADELARIDRKWTGRPVGENGGGRAALLVVALMAFAAMAMLLIERLRAARDRESMRRRLEESQRLESLGRLAGGIAHDFNNMLCAILGNAEVGLLDSPRDDPRRVLFEEIRHAAERSADLTRQLLAFARRQTVVPKVIDLNRAIEETLRLLRRLVGARIALEFSPDPDAPPVRIDPAQVDQLLANLGVNARDAIAGEGRIRIATSRVILGAADLFGAAAPPPGEYALLTFSDDGCGMTAETRAHAFEPFFTTKAPGAGTGLGLASVHGAVMQNGGFIDLSSAPGAGTTVRILLPRHESPAAPDAAPAAAAAA